MQGKKPVLLQVLPALQSGGIERGTVDMVKATVEAGFVSLVASNGGILVSQIIKAGGQHIELPLHNKNPFVIYRNIGKLANIIREYNVDILHARSRAPAWSAYFACRKTGCKFVTTVHGSYSVGKGLLGRLKKIYNSSMLKGDRVIAVSNFIKEYILNNYQKTAKIEAKDITVIHRGVDVNYFNIHNVSERRVADIVAKWNLPDDKKVIFMPGRMDSSWKGHDFLVESLAKVKNDDFICIFAGKEGSDKRREELESKIINSGLAGKIRIVDNVTDMPAAYILASIVISASIRPEAFGRVAIEGQAMGQMVIATKIGGSLETIIDGETGWLVEPNNSDEMAQKIDYVFSLDKNNKSKIADHAIKHARENFSNELMYGKTIEIYRELMR